MSKISVSARDSEPLNPEDVKIFLESRPDFVAKYPELLKHLSIPHHVSPKVSSLIEYQIHLLKKENSKLKIKLKELIDIAKDNEKIAIALYKLAARLLQAKTIHEVFDTINTELTKTFSKTCVVTKVLPECHLQKNECILPSDIDLGVISSNLFKDKEPVFGLLEQTNINLLFDKPKKRLKSMVIIPLYTKFPLGFICMGSVDEQRFNESASTDFLNQLATLVSSALMRFSSE